MIRPPWRIAIRSARCSASSRSCVVSSTVVPPSVSSLTVCHTSRRAWGSSPVVGSSRKMTGGFPMRLIAMSRRRRMPPEYVDTLRAGRVGQREALEQVIRDRARVLEVPQPGDQHEVLPPAEDFVDRRELPGEADGLTHVRRLRGDIEAVDAGGSRVGLEQRAQDVHDGGLARPVRAEQGEDAAPRHVEVHAAQHLQFLVRLLQALNVDGCIRGHCCPPRSASSIDLIRRARSLSIHCVPL